MPGHRKKDKGAPAGIHIPGTGKKPNSPVKDDGVHYHPPGPIAQAFLRDDSLIVGLRGPFGSGKSTVVVMKLIKNCRMQRRDPNGWIFRRTAIIRNTYPELRTTTMKTWHQWVPQHMGKWRDSGPPTHRIVDERQKIDWEIIFIALDKPDDVSKLLSMELSDAWVNEARETPKAIIDGLTGRVGRFPSHAIVPCDNPQILMDTNPPDTSHWWYVLAERDVTNEHNRQLIQSMEEAEAVLRLPDEFGRPPVLRPDQPLMKFYAQPSGLSEFGENKKNLRPGYYQVLSAGKTQDYIKVYVHGEYGFVMDGKPVYPEYVDSTHCREFEISRNLGIRLGFDWGLTPACSFSQRLPNGRWLVFDEVVSERLGIAALADQVKRKLAEKYRDFKIISARGDPSGDAVTPEESTCFMIMNAAGVPAEKAPTNDPTRRKEGVKFLLTNLIDGEPAILVHPRCNFIRKALSGGYHFRRLLVAGEMKYREVPEKNAFSHVMEALEYDVVSAGEDRNVTIHPDVRHRQNNMPQIAESDYPMFG